MLCNGIDLLKATPAVELFPRIPQILHERKDPEMIVQIKFPVCVTCSIFRYLRKKKQ